MSIVKIHNAANGEIIEREMNEQEIIDLQIVKNQSEAEKKSIEDAIKAKAALLDKLGITEEEAKLLLS